MRLAPPPFSLCLCGTPPQVQRRAPRMLRVPQPLCPEKHQHAASGTWQRVCGLFPLFEKQWWVVVQCRAVPIAIMPLLSSPVKMTQNVMAIAAERMTETLCA